MLSNYSPGSNQVSGLSFQYSHYFLQMVIKDNIEIQGVRLGHSLQPGQYKGAGMSSLSGCDVHKQTQ